MVAILAIAGAAARIYYSQSGAPQKFDLNPYNALGAGVAEETTKLIGDKGQVVVIVPDISEFENVVVEGQLNSFQETLKESNVTIATTVRFKLTPAQRMGGAAVPRYELLTALQRHPDVGAFVLFCPFPSLASRDYDTLKQSGAKYVVAAGYAPNYRGLLQAHVIDLAIVPQFNRSTTPANKPQTLREWFESEFVIITPDNIANLPY